MGSAAPLRIASIAIVAWLAGGAGDLPLAVVTRTQEGVAGKTGTRTTLSSDGSYVVEQFVGGNVVAQLRSGQLSAAELAKARAAIEAAKLAEQPPSAGVRSPVNAQEVSVEAAGVQRHVISPPGPAGVGSAAMQGPVAELARSLNELTMR